MDALKRAKPLKIVKSLIWYEGLGGGPCLFGDFVYRKGGFPFFSFCKTELKKSND